MGVVRTRACGALGGTWKESKLKHVLHKLVFTCIFSFSSGTAGWHHHRGVCSNNCLLGASSFMLLWRHALGEKCTHRMAWDS